MAQPLRWLIVLILLFATAPLVRAQNTISTQTLGVASICPGSPLTVAFTRIGTYNANNTFTVQLSDGSDYKNIETGTASFNSSTNVYTLVATIPSNQAAGTTYSIRVTASSPAVIGTPSATKLTVKTKPNAPTVDAVQLDCQRRTANESAFTYVYIGITAGASASLYNSNLSLNSNDILNTSSPSSVYFQLSRPFAAPTNEGYKYPISEVIYFVAQTINGCESDKVQTIMRVLYRPTGGPRPANQFSTNLGKLSYCQGDKALPLNVNGHDAPPENYEVSYSLEGTGNSSPTRIPPIPDTSVPNNQNYRLGLVPIDEKKGCISVLGGSTYLNVIVSARPTKPTVTTSTISLCQFQQAGSPTASVSGGASLVWYGTNATGGTGSTSASLPSTANAGTFKYYVAQKLNDCESERTEITVEVKAAAPAPAVSGVSYCQGAQAGQLSAIAASGGSLIWYTASSGGTGSPGGPTPSTTNVGVQTFYVSQLVGSSCESARVALSVTINGSPTAPFIPKSTYTFCQYATGEALFANGQNLKWYETATGGTGTVSLTPNTALAGTKLYYASQTVNGCEGPRSSVAVDVLAAPAAPTVSQTTYEFCQGLSNATITGTISPASQTSWYIYGDEPGLTSAYTSGSTSYATISTVQARTLTYSLFQTAANGCKGPASQLINITVKPTPAMPGVQAIAICQNTAAPVLQPTGQNLLWYTTSTGGNGSTITPIVSTSQASQTSYYVSQVLNSCESTRAVLSVTVNAIPGVPTLASAGPVYCQNSSALALAATGQGLTWYRESSGGTSLGNSVTPETSAAGNFTYYVSQTINGCEGSRSSLTVKVNASPSMPSVTNTVSYCQKTAIPALTASGDRLRWYDVSGKSSDIAPTPSTDVPGTVSYFVTQTVDNCESPRAEIKVTTKPTPGAPGTSALSICQNDTSQMLSVNGKNLLWYTAETGGTGSASAPRVNTNQATQITYYVSQTLDGCEGPRAALAVTVKSRPSAPGVTQKDICQFAKTELVAATGVELKWYNLDGNKFDTTPLINTEKGATLTYLVTQTVNGCEGPRATLAVNVLTTPVPVVSKTTVEFCQGVTAQPLDASGTNLKWTDPNGVISTTAPAPSTLNATQPDGYQYYVTQTGANGCESSKVGIRVFVQTVPKMSISGSTTINLGLEVPLKLSFTGVGPYRYLLTNGLSGTAAKDTTVLVLPYQTTLYQVVEVANKCGIGSPGNGATATITVLVPNIQTLALTTTTLCAGAGLSAGYLASGSFNTGSVFKLQFAKVETDSAKVNFVDMTTSQVVGGQLVGVVPITTPAGQYWVRVMSTNPKVPILGKISPTVLNVRPLATAMLTGNQTIFEGQSARLSIALTGDAPWVITYRDTSMITGASTIQTISATASPYSLEVKPPKTTSYYLAGISNVCGNGISTGGFIVVNVAPLLGIEDQLLADAIDVFPVPATTTLSVRIGGLSAKSPASLELTNLAGQILIRHETVKETSTLTLDSHPTGTYILQIRVGNRTASKRIIKL